MATAQAKQGQILGEPHYVQSGFSVLFPRQLDIRRKINDFETKLSGRYGQPQVVNIPDELDAEAPRAIFISGHGYSQIIVSQVSITLNVNYSRDEWQTNSDLREPYLLERAGIVFDLVGLIKPGGKTLPPSFCGFTTTIQIPSAANDVETTGLLSSLLGVKDDISVIYDINRRIARVVAKKYFSNITIENYRTWEVTRPAQEIIKLPREKAVERGIRIIGDYNDRYAFQERKTYSTSKSEMFKVIQQGRDAVIQAVKGIEDEYKRRTA